MAMKMREVDYGPPTKQILAIPDHYVALAFRQEQADTAGGMVTQTAEGRLIVQAGTFYPANDETAIGVVLNDYDVTDGDAMMAVVVHGFILEEALPEAPKAASESAIGTKAALPMIKFVEKIAKGE